MDSLSETMEMRKKWQNIKKKKCQPKRTVNSEFQISNEGEIKLQHGRVLGDDGIVLGSECGGGYTNTCVKNL